ncbi:LuxR C-terminal-related transcriptional regulator [Kitasatospora sp. NPDC004615]|uniref:LuxR C-terminal-related transcriptional regulator n=1 Tax=Kitasatospora sp. NPDC004615 TaxID=3364017 RepID=UPI00369D60C7
MTSTETYRDNPEGFGERTASTHGIDRLLGRRAELAALRRCVRQEPGAPRALVLLGEEGIGKSRLLRTAAEQAAQDGHLVLTAQGWEPEREVPYGVLRQLLAPVSDAAFDAGSEPAAAVAALLDGTPGQVLIAVDDAHACDRPTLELLGSLVRRPGGSPVSLLLAARDFAVLLSLPADTELLHVDPLSPSAAAELLDAVPGAPAGRARLEVLEEAEGNPSALLELCRRRAFRTDPAAARSRTPRLHTVRTRFDALIGPLPAPTRRALVHAALALPGDDASAVMAALGTTDLGIWAPAEEAGILALIDGHLVFRHPLARAAAAGGQPAVLLAQAHRALADRAAARPLDRIRHLVAATVGPDASFTEDLRPAIERATDDFALGQALEDAARVTTDTDEQARLLAEAMAAAVSVGDPDWVRNLHARFRGVNTDPRLARLAALAAAVALSHTSRQKEAFDLLLDSAALHPSPETALAAKPAAGAALDAKPVAGSAVDAVLDAKPVSETAVGVSAGAALDAKPVADAALDAKPVADAVLDAKPAAGAALDAKPAADAVLDAKPSSETAVGVSAGVALDAKPAAGAALDAKSVAGSAVDPVLDAKPSSETAVGVSAGAALDAKPAADAVLDTKPSSETAVGVSAGAALDAKPAAGAALDAKPVADAALGAKPVSEPAVGALANAALDAKPAANAALGAKPVAEPAVGALANAALDAKPAANAALGAKPVAEPAVGALANAALDAKPVSDAAFGAKPAAGAALDAKPVAGSAVDPVLDAKPSSEPAVGVSAGAVLDAKPAANAALDAKPVADAALGAKPSSEPAVGALANAALDAKPAADATFDAKPVAEPASDAALDTKLAALAAAIADQSGLPEHRGRLAELLAALRAPAPGEQDATGVLGGFVRALATRPAGARRAPARRSAPGNGTPESLVRRLAVASVAYLSDEPDDCLEHFRAADSLLRGRRAFGLRAWHLPALLDSLLGTGQWTEAAALLDEAKDRAAVLRLTRIRADLDAFDLSLRALRGTAPAGTPVPPPVPLDVHENLATQVRTVRALAQAAMAHGEWADAYRRLRTLFAEDGTPRHPFLSSRCLVDLAVAAHRAGLGDRAAQVLHRVQAAHEERPTTRMTLLLHHATALLDPGPDPEHHFRLALVNADGERWPLERAQARLSYAIWLRRVRRPSEARQQLAAALDTAEALGSRPLADTIRHELRATGVATATDTGPALGQLTAQQQQIVRMAAQGLSNREIGERLFLSPRTVGTHLYNVYPKLGVSSRHQLRDLLPTA